MTSQTSFSHTGSHTGTSASTDRTVADLRAFANREWLPLPGGELEAPRAKALCPSCRAAGRRSLCLNCFRAERERERALIAARDFDTASEGRFQTTLPFEPVNRARLNQLRAARQTARVEAQQGVGRYVDKRRQAQIAARHALQRLAEGLKTRGITVSAPHSSGLHRPVSHPPVHHSQTTAAMHAADVPLPDSWLPFVAQATSGRS